MEVESLHAELQQEDGGVIRVCYRLLEQHEKGETRYGIASFVEGAAPRPWQYCCLPDYFGNRRIGLSVLTFLCEKGVMPVHIETVLQENLL